MDVNPKHGSGLPNAAEEKAGQAELAVRAELMRRHWSTITFANLIITFTTVYLFWGHVDPRLLWGWLGCAVALMSIRMVYHLLLGRGRLDPAPDQQLRFYTLTAIAAGLIWAAAVMLFLVPDNAERFVFLLVVTLALSAGSLPIYAAHLPAHYGFSGILLATLIVKLFMAGTDAWLWLGVLAVIFLLANLAIAHNLNRIITSAITADLKNRELLEQVTEAKELAEAANRSKSRFLAAASHDLRQPLHAMGLFIDALKQRVSDAKDKEVVGYLGTSQKSLENMFNTLLEVSKLDAGVVEVRREDFEIGAMINELAQEMAPEIEEKNIQLTLNDCRGVVRSDRILVERILRNLLSNAVRYTEEGGVTLSCTRSGRELHVKIADTGIGIEPVEQHRIFDEFHQARNLPREQRGGMGLGLAIVRRMADLLGHEVHLKSEPGRGSIFSICLPVGTIGKTDIEPVQRDPQPLAGNRVLVIDDEDDILTALTMVLRDWGCESITAQSLDEAVRRAAEQRPDLILSDYQLSEDDADNGLDAINRIRTDMGADIPAVVISGVTDPALLRKVRVAGLKLLYKPVDARQLQDTLLSLGLARVSNPADRPV